MMKTRSLLLSGLLALTASPAFCEITLQECLAESEANYPLIRQYELIEKTKTISLADINRQWLPSVGVYGQATIQNAIAEFPSALTDIMAQMGREMRGLGKFQYKVGIDLAQPIWDGGATSAQRSRARAAAAESDAALAVSIYAVREKVMSLFFGALLIDRQIKQQEEATTLLRANHRKVEAMVTNGAAMQSDADNIAAQIVANEQMLIEARTALDSYRRLLGLYMGRDLGREELAKPEKALPAGSTSNRPELTLFDARIASNNTQRAEIRSSVMPKVSAFVQSFYGYPGFNNFEAMMNRKLSFNILGGVKVNWNLSSLYNRKSSLQKIELSNLGVETERNTFLFNSALQTQSQNSEIRKIEEVIARDGEIIRLRSAVRAAAEAQLDNGVIDTVSLLSKITDENRAKLNADYHEIKLLQTIYQLKNTLNQ